MGKAQRVKGRAFEQEICRFLKAQGIDAKRILEFQQSEANGVDVETDKLIIQAKCMKQVPNIPKVFSEFKRDDKIQVVMFRVTNKGTYACLRIEDALELFLEN